jgi:hypothetical protein
MMWCALLLVETDNNPVTLSVASGFVLVDQKGVVSAGGDPTMIQVFWNRATNGSMSPVTIATPVNHQVNRMMTFRGCITTGNPYEALGNASSAAVSTSVDVNATGVSTVGTNRLVLCAIAAPTDTAIDQFSVIANTSLASPGAYTDSFTQQGNGGGFALLKGTRAAAGNLGHFTATLGTANAWAAVFFALKGPTDIVSTPPTSIGDGGFTQATGARTPSWPAGLAVGDIGVMFVETAGQPIATVPTGWAHAPNSPQTIGTPGASDATYLAVLWKRVAVVPEANLSIGDSGDHNGATIVVYRGCIETGSPWDPTAGAANTLGVASASVTVPGSTTGTNNCLVLQAVGHGIDATGNQVSGVWTSSGLTSVTKRLDHSDTGGNGGGFSVLDGIKAVAGAYAAATCTLLASTKQTRWTGALLPAGSASAPPPNPQGNVNIPHQFWRLKLTNAPGAGPDFTEVELVTRTGTVAATGSLLNKPAQMHPGTTHLRPLIVVNRSNTDGIFEVDFLLMTVPAGYSPDKFADDVRKRNDSIYQSDGTLKPGVVQYDGATGLPLVKGVQQGAGRHGDPIIYDPPYQTVPKVKITGGIPSQPESRWTTSAADASADSGVTAPSATAQQPDYGVLNATAAGFTIRARLRQAGAATLRTHNFAGTVLDTVDETDEVTLTSAPASNDLYSFTLASNITFHSLTGNPFYVSMFAKIESNDGSGWVERLTVVQSFNTSSPTIVSQSSGYGGSISVAGLDPTDKIRIRFVSITTSGIGQILAANIVGNQVTYYTSTDQYASKTPANLADAHVDWESVGYL